MYTSSIIRKRWGPKPVLSRWLFTGIIRPKLTYASLVWGHTINKKFIQEKLRKLNRLAAITITPIYRSIPTKGLEVMFDLMPLELLIQQTALGAKQRLNEVVKYDWRGSNKTGTILGRIRHWENREETLGIRQTVNDSCRELLRERNYKINSDSFRCTPRNT